MNVLIVGAGAIGMWLADRLNQSDPSVEVTLVGRPRFAVEARGGLFLEPGPGRPRAVRCTPAGGLEELAGRGPFNLIALAMKAHGVDEALDALKATPSLWHADTRMLAVQNGIGSEEKLIAAYGPARVLSATITVPVAVVAPNRVRIERDKGGMGMAAMDGGVGPELTRWCGAFQARAYPDWRAMKWSKLLLNSVGNASSAIFDLPVAELYADARGFALERRMLHEILAVIEGLRLGVVDLPGSPARALAAAVRLLPDVLLKPLLARAAARGRGDKRPSFYYDLANGNGRSEVQFLNGAVAAAGRGLGIPTPVNRALARVLSALVEGRQRREDWRNRLDRAAEMMRPD